MKKLILLFSTLTLPLTAMAQDKPIKMSNTVIETATDKFVPLICKKGLNEALTEVQKCYKNTPATYPEIEQCLVSDFFIVILTNQKNQNDMKKNNPISFPTSYINLNQYAQRIEKYHKEIPQYQQYSRLEFRRYIGKSTDDFFDELSLMKHDQTSHCIEE